MPPKRSNLVLSSDIPYRKGDILVFDSLDVETYCGQSRAKLNAAELRTDRGDGRNDLAQLELVKDCRFTSRIETDHENTWRESMTIRRLTFKAVLISLTHFLLTKQALKESTDGQTHDWRDE